ncbi:MAG: 3-isopropylmalate dehydratase large subunit [Paracoccaceae bacterium]
MPPRSLFDKLWDSHVIVAREDGQSLLWIDRHLAHEGSHHAFAALEARDATLARPDLTFAVADHYAPVKSRDPSRFSPQVRTMLERLEANCATHGVQLFGLDDPRQGIVHVIGPELGLTLPGLTLVCGDSHTSTHGAFGAMAFGIGASEVAHVMQTQTLWQRKPRQMRILVEGALGRGVSAKDLALDIISRIGADGARGHVIEYAGRAVRGLGMEGRMTLCNLSIESGARCGMIAPDAVTFDWVRGRPFAPRGEALARAEHDWLELRSDPEARFDRELRFDADEVAPTVTWGTSPEEALPVTAALPDPDRTADPSRAAQQRAALDYMGLRAGQPIDEITIDRVFIGSCTNARIEDLRAAATVLRGSVARVPGLVAPGSAQVKAQAEREGLDEVFRDAGLTWAAAGCSMCVGMNGDIGAPGERCASTTNRNFRGRQGPGVRTHLMSPAMAAAAALNGRITDLRKMTEPAL